MKMFSKRNMVGVIILGCLLAGCRDEGDQCYGSRDDVKCYSYEYNLEYHDDPTVIRLPFYAEPLQREIYENSGNGWKTRWTEYVDKQYNNLKMTCVIGGDIYDHSDECPVLSWKGHVYWVYSAKNNWTEISIIAAPIEAPRSPVKEITRYGGRYIVDIRIEERGENEPLIVLVLQGNKEMRFNLDELRIE